MLKSVSKGIAALCAASAKAAPTVARDLVGLGGAGLISYGAWLMYPPAGFIVAGVLILAGILIATTAAKA
jgi:hypothetical protein